MAEGDIGAILDSLEFDAVNAQYPMLVWMSGNIYAVAYTGPDADGWVATVSIDAAGNIGAAVIDKLEFDVNGANYVNIIRVSGTVAAIAYFDVGGLGKLVTVLISDVGAIEASPCAPLFFDAVYGTTPRMIHVAGDVFAIVYRNNSIYGRAITVSISVAGVIYETILSELNFETTRGISPSITHVVNDIYAVAYQGIDDDGWVATFSIDAAGNIGAAVIDTLEFDVANVKEAEIIQINEEIYAVAYTDAANNGKLVTFSIDAAGNIGAGIINSLVWDFDGALEPGIVHVSGDVFAIVYRGLLQVGRLRTFSINAAGEIGATAIDSYDFTAVTMAGPQIFYARKNIYVLTWQDADGDGQVATVDIETLLPGGSPHALMMGMYP